MGKACLVFWTIGIGSFIGYAWVNATTDVSPWYLTVLFIAFQVFGALFLITGLLYLAPLVQKHLVPLVILDDVSCNYWTKEKQIQVRLSIADYSNAENFKASCVAQFGKQIINLDDKVNLDGHDVHSGDSRTNHPKSKTRMLEFYKYNVNIENAGTAKVTVNIKPLRGRWIGKRKQLGISTNLIDHQQVSLQ